MMRTFANFLVGLLVLGLYPLLGTIMALIFPDKGSNWSWGAFGVGPVILICALLLIAFACGAVIFFGAAVRRLFIRDRRGNRIDMETMLFGDN